jgi:hypothetical protein
MGVCRKGWPWTPHHARPFYALRLFQGWLARRAGGLWASSTPLDIPRRTPMVQGLAAEPHPKLSILLTFARGGAAGGAGAVLEGRVATQRAELLRPPLDFDAVLVAHSRVRLHDRARTQAVATWTEGGVAVRGGGAGGSGGPCTLRCKVSLSPALPPSLHPTSNQPTFSKIRPMGGQPPGSH